MTDKERLLTEFYRDLYVSEYERMKFYDKVIQYPTTLLVIFIGVAFYSLNNYYINGQFIVQSTLDKFFMSFVILFCISIIFTILFLSRLFHGFTRRYHYLPFSMKLHEHEKELYKHYYKFSDKKSSEDKKSAAKERTCQDFCKNIRKYYIELADINQKINDKRAEAYSKTRAFLFLDLIFLIVIAIIEIIK